MDHQYDEISDRLLEILVKERAVDQITGAGSDIKILEATTMAAALVVVRTEVNEEAPLSDYQKFFIALPDFAWALEFMVDYHCLEDGSVCSSILDLLRNRVELGETEDTAHMVCTDLNQICSELLDYLVSITSGREDELS
jgi:hypothetical protein